MVGMAPSTASRSPSPRGGGLAAAHSVKFLPLWGRETTRSVVEGAPHPNLEAFLDAREPLNDGMAPSTASRSPSPKGGGLAAAHSVKFLPLRGRGTTRSVVEGVPHPILNAFLDAREPLNDGAAPSTASRSPSPKGGGLAAAHSVKFLPLWGRGTTRSVVEGAPHPILEAFLDAREPLNDGIAPSTASRSPSPKGGGLAAAQSAKFLPLWGRGTTRSVVEGA